MKKTITTLTIALLLLLASTSVLAQRGGGEGAALVAVSEVVETNLAPVTMVAGTVVSRLDSLIAAEQDGRIIEIQEVGTVVKAGDILAKIDPIPMQLRVNELVADVERVRARLAFTQAEYKRQQELSQRQLTSATMLEQTRSDQKVAASELAVAESRLHQARDELSRTQIKAPFEGVVLERRIQVGERVNIGAVVIRMADANNLEVVARPPLTYFPFVDVGKALEVTSNRGSQYWPVRTKVSLGNEDTHVFEVRMDVDPTQYASGETVRVGIPIAASGLVIAVPRDALVLRSSGTSVFVLQDDMTVRQENVTPGVGNSTLVGVQGNIRPGEQVVIRGNERLRSGQTVELLGV